MFADLINRLTANDPEPMNDGDARLALTALLVRIARSDNEYAPAEIAQIDRITEARYGLSKSEAENLRKEAEEVEAGAPDTVRFTRAIKDAVPYDSRRGVVEAMWQLVLADGDRADAENALMRLTANLLGVTDRDSALARQKAETR
ncbi:MAG: tellurite resistance TerB family protein [Heliomarina sp.]|uniref:tellurite resistance TerB family protein n=1 Tax=Heliomarina sp. TaxID=2917556 RepID=UPI004058D5B9